MNELFIQQRLYWQLGHKREYCMPNVFLYGRNESDFVTLTRAGYVDEYEIKISRSDFQADKKKHRHDHYTQGHKSESIVKGLPNRFWYVVPEGLIETHEAPEYAGLLYVRENGFIIQCRAAPKLHNNKAGPRVSEQILRAGYFRHVTQWARKR